MPTSKKKTATKKVTSKKTGTRRAPRKKVEPEAQDLAQDRAQDIVARTRARRSKPEPEAAEVETQDDPYSRSERRLETPPELWDGEDIEIPTPVDESAPVEEPVEEVVPEVEDSAAKEETRSEPLPKAFETPPVDDTELPEGGHTTTPDVKESDDPAPEAPESESRSKVAQALVPSSRGYRQPRSDKSRYGIPGR
jgi:hypothetical protein